MKFLICFVVQVVKGTRCSRSLFLSEIFPGLWLDASALLRGDLATVLQILGAGVASQEHEVFVADLKQKPAASDVGRG